MLKEYLRNLPCGSIITESWSQETLMSPFLHFSSQKYHFDLGETHAAFLLLTPLNTPRLFTTLFVLH